MYVMSAANRDPAVFDQPDDFVCPRDHNPHLTFGFGIHRCPGEPLALLEMRIVAEEVLRMIPAYRVAQDYQPRWIAGTMFRGLTALPVTFH